MKTQFEADTCLFVSICASLPQPFVIYGAGHYCQLMLNNTHVKPLHIFDSNPQKCGKKMNGLIVEHKDAMQHDFQSILVMCGIYNSEVVKMLKTMNRTEEIVAWKN
jgi:NADH/NAD ratio-sensing transcriptional regulator Rex